MGMFRIRGCLVLLVVFLASEPMSAAAQIPYVHVYSDPAFDDNFIGCPPSNAQLGTPLLLYVVLHNWTEPFSAVDFSIIFPNELVYVADIAVDPVGSVMIGTSPSGIAIAWGGCCLPDASTGTTLLLTILVLTAPGCNCHDAIRVSGYGPLSKSNPTLVRYPDFSEVQLYGMSSGMCGTTPVEPTTWGKVKSLYR